MATSSRHDRIYRALLRLFPREFRGDFREQMEEDFREQREDASPAGRRSVAGLWMRTAADLLRRAPREHFDVLIRDAGYAVRLFRRRPGMTLSALLTLAIGIGVNAAAFTVVEGVLWRSLPLPGSDRLVRIAEVRPPTMSGNTAAPANVLDWQAQARTLDMIATIGFHRGTIVQDAGAEQLLGAAVSREFFRMLPVRPLLGRLLEEQDYAVLDAQMAARDPRKPTPRLNPAAMVISHDLWQRQFGGRTNVVGSRVDLGAGGVVEVVGVTPPDFVVPFFRNALAWLPGVLDPYQRAPFLMAVGRLASGATVEKAQAEFDAIAGRLASAHPKANANRRIRVVSLRDSVTAGVRTQLWFLFGTTLCLLLIACANISSLLLSLAAGRQRELATRLSLGATRAHLVRQALTEGLVLAFAGGAMGLLLAWWAVPLLTSMAPASIRGSTRSQCARRYLCSRLRYRSPWASSPASVRPWRRTREASRLPYEWLARRETTAAGSVSSSLSGKSRSRWC